MSRFKPKATVLLEWPYREDVLADIKQLKKTKNTQIAQDLVNIVNYCIVAAKHQQEEQLRQKAKIKRFEEVDRRKINNLFGKSIGDDDDPYGLKGFE